MMYQKACGYLRTGKAEKASRILKKLVSHDRGWCNAVYNLGVAYMLQGRWQDAASAFLKTINIDPQVTAAYGNLCSVLAESGEFEKAVEYGEKGLLVDPSYIGLYNALAIALEPLDRFDEAIGYLRKALAIKGDNPTVLKNLWGVLYRTGQKEETEEVVLKYLQLKPDDVVMHRMLSMVRKYSLDDEHITHMEKLLMTAPEKADLHFALGKAYEDIGDYQQSFEHYDAANKSKRSTFEYSSDQDKEFFEQIRQVFTKDFIECSKNSERSEAPIFVVGMPRSGTSLVEQILASHPEVYGVGESSYINMMQFKTGKRNRKNYVRYINNLKPYDFKNMGDLFLKKFERVWNGHSYIIDKTPQNFRYLGLIKILFPKAKIIHCAREPRDTCFSIFKTLFVGMGDLSFSFSQKEIAAYYKLYEELMAHWYNVLPEGSVYDLQYETLVENPEDSISSLLKYCDLEWYDGCVQFHKTKRAVGTASTLQVRQPLYKGAVGYWRNYEPYLDEIVSEFGDKK